MDAKSQLEADLNILVNEVANGQGFLARRAILGQAEKVKTIARRILLPIYMDAAEHRKNEYAKAEKARDEHLSRSL